MHMEIKFNKNGNLSLIQSLCLRLTLMFARPRLRRDVYGLYSPDKLAYKGQRITLDFLRMCVVERVEWVPVRNGVIHVR